MAEIRVHTAWRWTCPHCGMRRIITSSATKPQGSAMMSEIADHFANDHKLLGVQVHRLTEPVFLLNIINGGVLVG